MRILLVEDDPGIGAAVQDQTIAEGHCVDRVMTIADARACLLGVAYDLILLDLMLPDGGGLTLLRDLRARGSNTPVIILTARDRITERIEGLNAGADDYLVKPFDLDELSARIGAVARRYAGKPNPLIRLGELQIDLASRGIFGPEGRIDLSQREWAIFEALLQRPGSILTKPQLEERLYSFDSEVESNTIEVYVSRLRKKLGRDAIETLRGLGYRLGHPGAPAWAGHAACAVI
jgi:two-component system OmpR family response regulator